ncbi:Lsr2 family protein [Glycomyces sp. NPDC049804]|uniref:histone-like nucleoid-structuring protein Lsr2 n=1 Tax=Glycomyces sp. NPDC049804 TaxID=3154363 RepID=UPI0034222615
MAKLKQVTRIDDLDGSEPARAVEFGIAGQLFVVDLSESHQQELFGALSKFIAAATPLGRYRIRGVGRGEGQGSYRRAKGRLATSVETAGRSREVRDWAAQAGIYVHPRGRVPQQVIEMFEQARAA